MFRVRGRRLRARRRGARGQHREITGQHRARRGGAMSLDASAVDSEPKKARAAVREAGATGSAGRLRRFQETCRRGIGGPGVIKTEPAAWRFVIPGSQPARALAGQLASRAKIKTKRTLEVWRTRESMCCLRAGRPDLDAPPPPRPRRAAGSLRGTSASRAVAVRRQHHLPRGGAGSARTPASQHARPTARTRRQPRWPRRACRIGR